MESAGQRESVWFTIKPGGSQDTVAMDYVVLFFIFDELFALSILDPFFRLSLIRLWDRAMVWYGINEI